MKQNFASLVVGLLIFCQSALADQNQISLGLGSLHTGNANGGTFSVTSPYFNNGLWAVQVGYSLLSEPLPTSSRVQEFDFQLVDAGLVLSSMIIPNLRGYWRLGLGLFMPPQAVSGHLSVSGTGVLGLEFMPSKTGPFTFFGELGGIYAIDGCAENLPGKPFFGRGGRISTGVRVYL